MHWRVIVYILVGLFVVFVVLPKLWEFRLYSGRKTRSEAPVLRKKSETSTRLRCNNVTSTLNPARTEF